MNAVWALVFGAIEAVAAMVAAVSTWPRSAGCMLTIEPLVIDAAGGRLMH